MPILNLEFDLAGRPMIELYVAVGTTHAAERRANGDPVLGVLPVRALLDTGAKQSHVSLNIIRALGLEPVGVVDLFTASTGDLSQKMPLYVVDLACAGDRPGPFVINWPVVGSSKMSGLNVEMLLGRDILNACLLAYDGPNRRISLAYDRPETQA
jgi:hypothetical protein